MPSGKIKKGDSGNKLYFYLKTANGQPFDLTSATVSMTMAGGNTGKKKVQKTCVIESAENGECYCILSQQDTQITGKYSVEVTIHKEGNQFTTITTGTLEIMEVL